MNKDTEDQIVRDELLEELRENINANFISDLRYAPHLFKAIRYLADTPADRYTLQEWNDAIVYLLKNIEPCTDSFTAKQKFVSAVHSKKRFLL